MVASRIFNLSLMGRYPTSGLIALSSLTKVIRKFRVSSKFISSKVLNPCCTPEAKVLKVITLLVLRVKLLVTVSTLFFRTEPSITRAAIALCSEAWLMNRGFAPKVHVESKVLGLNQKSVVRNSETSIPNAVEKTSATTEPDHVVVRVESELERLSVGQFDGEFSIIILIEVPAKRAIADTHSIIASF